MYVKITTEPIEFFNPGKQSKATDNLEFWNIWHVFSKMCDIVGTSCDKARGIHTGTGIKKGNILFYSGGMNFSNIGLKNASTIILRISRNKKVNNQNDDQQNYPFCSL